MSSTPIVTITRRETFSAAHRLHSHDMTPEENLEIFGKCNNLNGHGHNYAVEVSIRGPVDRRTGMVMNLTDLKKIMEDSIMKPLDHRNIDKEVPHFKQTPSTAENIAVFIWEAMRSRLDKPELLHKVKLWETDKNFVVYQGAKTMPKIDRRMSENICANMSSDSE